MNRKLAHTLLIFVGTIIFSFLIAFTAIKIYTVAIDETKRNHQTLQKEIADATTAGVTYYMEHLAEDLHWLATSFPGLQYFKKESPQSQVGNFFTHVKQYGVKAIFVTDLDAKIIYSTLDTLPYWINSPIKKQLLWAKNPDNYQKSWYSSVCPSDSNEIESELYFLVLVPLVQYIKDSKYSHSKIKPVGIVGKVVSFNWIVKQYIAPVNLGTKGAAWVMDGRGRLLFHPFHPEMILRDISEKSEDCVSCHPSFEIQKRMIVAEAAYGEYTVGEESTKIMSHVPIDIQDERWIIVITDYLSEVTAILRGRFRLFFILISIILIAIIFTGLLFYFLDTRRIRAEEAHRYMKQKEQLQQQIDNAAKLASIGELVDTVAHEINTPTGIILAHIDAILLRDNKKNKFLEELNIIKDQTWRISGYTRSLLDYSQRMPFKLEKTDLKKVLDECLFLLGHRFRANNIIIVKNYTSKLPLPYVDHRQIGQVFVNLLNNAIDAIKNQGKIKIDMVIKEDDGNKGIEICVTDDGEGISEKMLPQIFKSFISTKLPSKGTGLGLSITKAIIQRHHGKIKATSIEGDGATFTIFLPLNDNSKLIENL